MPINFTKRLLILLFLTPIMSISAQINYLFELTDPDHHLAEITVSIPQGQSLLTLKMPNWRTGNYKIINQSNGVRQFGALDSNQQALDWQRVDKSTWTINNPSKQAVTVKYQIYANELGRRTRHISDTHAFLDATAVFMYQPSQIFETHQIDLKVPANWKSYSGMEQLGEHQFVAQNYHQLADSPIETGINEAFEFTQDKRNYQVVFWGKANRDPQKIVDDLKSLVSQSHQIWKGYPYQKYVFMIHATSGAQGATEHLNSTVIQRARDTFGKREDYLEKFLRTASHEFVHTWNVKAYRPEKLVPYDYQKENYSDLLWIAEGSTSYFEDRLLLTAELQTVDEYLKSLSKRIDKFQHRPGHKVQSLKQASYEKWIAQGGDFANNHSANIYSEGFMLSWLLDFQILTDTKLKSGYKDLHQLLYQLEEKKSPDLFTRSYNTEDLKALLLQLTKKDYNNWWQENVNSPLDIDFKALLKKAGLEFTPLKEEDYKISAGFKSKAINGLLTLTQVESGSEAWKAGLTPEDQIIAVNGYQVTQDNFDKWLTQFEDGEQIELTLFREQRLIKKLLTVKKEPKKRPKIRLVKKPTRSQKAFFKAWLGVKFPKNKK